MTLLLALLFSSAGFAALAMAMDRHYRQIWRCTPSPSQRRWLRLLGGAGLTLSLALSITETGWEVGIVLWLGLLSFAALFIVSVLVFHVSRRDAH